MTPRHADAASTEPSAVSSTTAPPGRDPAAPVVSSVPLGGSALSRFIQHGRTPADWQLTHPTTVEGWARRVAGTQATFEGRDWWGAIAAAVSAEGAARARLERVVASGGVIVTTGQQPGLFGGPLYTWSKALSALALADELELATGVPTAPLFWAATDDADLVEAQRVWIAREGGASELQGGAVAPAGTPASAVKQGDLRDQLEALRVASGSAHHEAVLAATEAAYGDPQATVGEAYIALLAAVLAPLGIPILDASHPAVRAAAAPTVRQALSCAGAAEAALHARSSAIQSLGFEPQVADVAGLTPVFIYEGGAKRRVSLEEAAAVASAATSDSLGPNVLLRPIVEAAIVPTVAYVAGPGELAYFAQVTALAGALEARVPVAVPRWSGRIVEPRIQRLLDRLGIEIAELADPHAAETVLARAAMPDALVSALAAASQTAASVVGAIEAADTKQLIPPPVLAGIRRRLEHQFARLERRAVAAVKRREAMLMRDVATARGYFFPGGKPQERALSLVPFLARSGPRLLDAMLAEARSHATVLVGRSRGMAEPR